MSRMELPRLDGATASAAVVAANLESHGVVVIENLVESAQMERLRSDLDHREGVFYGAKGSFAGSHSTRNAGKPLGESKVAQDLAEHPLILQAVGLRLKPWCRRFVLGTCSNINVEPPPDPQTPPAPAQVLHRDEGMWGASDWNQWIPSTTHDRPEFSISVMWAISDFTSENGATRVAPGSHRWDRHMAQMHAAAESLGSIGNGEEKSDGETGGDLDDLAAEGQAMKHAAYSGMEDDPGRLEKLCIQATMSKGSVLLWSGATIHGAGAHSPCPASDDDNDDHPSFDREAATRRGLLFIYNLGWLRTEHNWNFCMPPEVIAEFPVSLRELMGIVGGNKVDHPWYTGPVYAQPLLGSADEVNESPLSVNSSTAFIKP